MKFSALLLSITALSLLSGCATRNTAGGGKETTVLGGAVTVTTRSFEKPAATAVGEVDTTKFKPSAQPTGAKTSLLWGLLTFRDY